jgi:hypothetical protein
LCFEGARSCSSIYLGTEEKHKKLVRNGVLRCLEYETGVVTVFLEYETGVVTVFLEYETGVVTVFLEYETGVVTVFLKYETGLLPFS